jgi:hypothetical protein
MLGVSSLARISTSGQPKWGRWQTFFEEPQNLWERRNLGNETLETHEHKGQSKSDEFRRAVEENVSRLCGHPSCAMNVLFELKDSAAHDLTVDLDVHAIGANSECARVQVVAVLTAINPEV